MKKTTKIAVLCMVILSLCLCFVLTACNNNKVTGKYFLEKSDGTLNQESWIELTGKNWNDDEGETGTYEIKGDVIIFSQDGEEIIEGTLVDGVLTIWDSVYKKEAGSNTQGSSKVDEKASVKSITGGKVEGLTVNLDVGNTIDNVELSGMISVSSGSSWQLYSDITGQTLIPTKYAANLKNGDNTYYIVVNSDDGKVNRTYTLNIHKQYYVSITYNSAGGTFRTDQVLTHTTLGVGPEITRTGYTFGGWECSGHYVTESKTFNAKWTANTYTVTFDANGGSVSKTSQTVLTGSSYTFPSAGGKTGHSFDGWYTRATGGTRLTNSDCRSITNWSIGENTTVYARWTINKYAVSIGQNISGAGSISGGGNKDYNSSVTIRATTNPGYTWLGWYEGNTKVSTDSSLTYTFTMPAGNRTYEARWETNTYKVRYNANGGVGTMTEQTHTYNQSKPLSSNIITRTGYTFHGWYTNAECVGVAFNDGENVNNLTDINNGIFELYAKWKASKYEVEYDGDNVTISKLNLYIDISFDLKGAPGTPPATQTVTPNRIPTYPIPIWEGKIFAGWELDPSYDEDTYLYEDIAFYAKWIEPSGHTGIIYPGGSITGINFNSTIKYYAYVPLVSETVTIYSTKTNGIPCASLCDSSKKPLISSNIMGYDSNFSFQYEVTAGTLYYIGYRCVFNSIRDYPGVGSLYVTGTSEPWEADESLRQIITYGENFDLQTLTDDEKVFVGWYDGDGGTGVQYTDGEGNSVKVWDKDEATATLYAKWSGGLVNLKKNISAAGSTEGSGKFAEGSSVNITATTNSGYTWIGWYDGETKVSTDSELTYTFIMPADNKTYEARWMLCPVTLEKNIHEAGTVSRVSEATAIDEQTTIIATTNAGYTWIGWFDGETKVSTDSELTYTFIMPAENKTYEARWMLCPITLEKNINEAGTVNGIETTILGGQTTITATTNFGYTWLGWYDEETKVSTDTSLTYTFIMSGEIKKYEARWGDYNIILNKNITQAGTVIGAGKYVAGIEQTITATTNAGYTWLGWYDGETKVSEGSSLIYTFIMPNESKTYEARWGDYSVTLSKNINEAGSIYGNQGRIVEGDLCEITAETNEGYTWLGWYDGEKKVSNDTNLTYTFTMPRESKKYEARWGDYNVVLSKNINEAGTIDGTQGRIEAGALCEITATTNSGYTWIGWYDGETKVSDGTSLLYTFIMPMETTIYEAKWMSCPVTIIKNIPDAGVIWGVEKTAIGAETIITATTNTGYTWLGWYCDDVKVSSDTDTTYVFDMSIEYKTYMAKWEANTYMAILDVNNGESIANSEINVLYNQAFEIVPATKQYYSFLGWFDGLETTSKKYTDNNGKSLIDWDKVQNSILYAHWEENLTDNYIISANDLKHISLSGNYILVNDINLESITWMPIGTYAAPFTGTFDGNGHRISNFLINNGVSIGEYYLGLFGYNKGNISNLYVNNYKIIAGFEANIYAGGLIGYNNGGTIKNCYAHGEINITSTSIYMYNPYAGGLIGFNEGGTITNCFSTNSKITATSQGGYVYAGGLLGVNSSGKVKYCYSTNNVASSSEWFGCAGGLVGENEDEIINCFAIGNATSASTDGRSYAGGLIGYGVNTSSKTCVVTNSYRYINQVISSTNEQTEGTPISLDSFTNENFLVNTIGFGEYISEDDLAKNADNVWVCIIYPKLYYFRNRVQVDYNIDAGSILGDGIYYQDEAIEMTAITKDGYVWLGWYDENEVLLTNNFKYSFTMPENNIMFIAKWIPFPIVLEKNINEAGVLNGILNSTEEKSQLIVTASTNEGYTWLGWYDGETKILIEDSSIYTFVMPFDNKTYEARWGDYNIALEKNIAEAGTVSGSTGRIVAGTECTITAITNTNYTWLGWYDGETKVLIEENLTFTFIMPFENKTFEARWGDYNITLEKNIAEAGTISGSTGRIVAGTECTISAITNIGYTWLGWYDGETKVSEDTSLSYIFFMQYENKTYTATWGSVAISTSDDLVNIGLIGWYHLSNDIDLEGAEWTPIGLSNDNSFSGIFDGGGYKIYNFKITTETRFIGLFGYNVGTIKNTGVEDFTINATSSSYLCAGGLIGYNTGTVTNCYATGNISLISDSNASAGGLIGFNSGTITDCYTTCNVSASILIYSYTTYAGGLVGYNYAGEINNCYTTGEVSATSSWPTAVGGLIGYIEGGTISNCYTTGNISSSSTSSSDIYSGGLVGYSYSCTIINCYATGNVSAIKTDSYGIVYVGGLIGYNYAGLITNCYRYSGQEFYRKSGETEFDTASNTLGMATSIQDLQLPSYLINIVKFGEYISWEDYCINPNNVWAFIDGQYPKLYWQD